MKAEIARELGKFEEALQLLEEGLPEELQEPAIRIRDLAAEGNGRILIL